MRRLAVVTGLVLLAHALLLAVAARWSFAAALLSPGPHSGLPALAFGLAFLGLRLTAYVGLPVCWAFCLASRLRLRIIRRPTSSTGGPGPMLSAPLSDSEVLDGRSR